VAAVEMVATSPQGPLTVVVHCKEEEQFRGILKWNRQGVDMVDLKTGRKYEILSGTESNLARHGRRMEGELFQRGRSNCWQDGFWRMAPNVGFRLLVGLTNQH
jgi:hypothetical protein